MGRFYKDFNSFMIDAHFEVKRSGLPNFLGCKILLPSQFNFKFIQSALRDYEDTQVIELLKYGFLLDHNGKTGSNNIPKNHSGATQFPEEMNRILQVEVSARATLGPFPASPFGRNICLSPLNSVPKKDTDRRRMILDLSMPRGNSVNDGISKDCYLGEWDKLKLPSVDALADRVMKLGRGCKLFKVDLFRSYHQFFLDPASINVLGFVYEGKFYFDCTLSIGSRSSARCCQRVTSAVVYIFTKEGYFAINYLDDLGSAEESSRADVAFQTLQDILVQFGLKEAFEKSVAPNTVMIFLGIEVNTVLLTLSIPEQKWNEIKEVLKVWLAKRGASLKETQSLAGLLNFACRCVRPGRVYLARILNFLRTLPKSGRRWVPVSVKEDVKWWFSFAEAFNGTSLMLNTEWSKPDEEISSDSCLLGGGAFSNGDFLHWEFPQKVLQLNCHINQLECLVLVVAVKTWMYKLHRKKLVVNCDNMVTVESINSRNSRDKRIQKCLRELHKVLAFNSIELKARFIRGEDNRISDALSRWSVNPKFREIFYRETAEVVLKEHHVKEELWDFMLKDE